MGTYARKSAVHNVTIKTIFRCVIKLMVIVTLDVMRVSGIINVDHFAGPVAMDLSVIWQLVFALMDALMAILVGSATRNAVFTV